MVASVILRFVILEVIAYIFENCNVEVPKLNVFVTSGNKLLWRVIFEETSAYISSTYKPLSITAPAVEWTLNLSVRPFAEILTPVLGTAGVITFVTIPAFAFIAFVLAVTLPFNKVVPFTVRLFKTSVVTFIVPVVIECAVNEFT